MAKVVKRSLDAARRAPVRKKSYEAPTVRRRKRGEVPREYRTMEKASKKGGGCLFFLFLIFIVALAGLVYWNKNGTTNIDESIAVYVNGPKKIISGDQITYNIEYDNLDIVTLENIKLSVRWPNGFYFDEATIDPSDANATTWYLEDLLSKQSGSLEIKGQLVGQKDDELSAVFTLEYQPANFHSDFSVKEVIDTKISDSKIELNIDSIDKTLVATDQTININFKNLTKEDLVDLYLDIIYPEDFILLDHEIEDEEESEIEEVDSIFITEGDYLKFSLPAEGEASMELKGIFSTDSKNKQSLVVEVGNMIDGNFRRLSRVTKDIQVINPKFDIDFSINGEHNNPTVNWGDTLRYQLEITNLSSTVLDDIVITALLDSQVLDWDSLDTIGMVQESNIIWTSTEDESLTTWPAGDTRLFTWQIDVAEQPAPERMIENILKINIQGLADWEQVTAPILVTVGEAVVFNNGIYWDLGGRRVGSGLLPPQVDESTQYLVIWSIPEATGDFETATVETILPPEVSFLSETDIQEGNLTFDDDTRSLTWQIDDLDNLLLPLTASFIIELIPTIDNLDSAMVLFNPTTMTAEGTEQVIIRSKMLKTSDVFADSNEPIGIVE
jgi:uncharacterized repeat protein (TIGR01451 family)